ncbi:Galactose-3-O-sulfotransferase 2 [Bulinus truncatus]|nr:Galactose-3-O-sulfotransferase 2 [Bulinus truncatus]
MWPRDFCGVLRKIRIRVNHVTLFALISAIVICYVATTAYIIYSKTPANVASLLGKFIYDVRGHDPAETQRFRSRSKVNSTCREKTNFVFIKGMKSATSTLLGVFYRFGYTRNLSFVSPLGERLYLNWPFPMTKLDYRPSGRGYNILTDHAVLTESVMAEIMPSDTVYISIVREPLAQVRSIFQYFKIHVVAGVPSDAKNPVVEYFAHFEKYESQYVSPLNKIRHSCYPAGFSMTRNLMSHCLGMPVGFPPGTRDISNSTAEVSAYLDRLDKKFGLIMVVEHFYESIILLRRLMCWAFRDIIFLSSNMAKYDFDVSEIDEKVRRVHREWGGVDYQLYDFFNRTLWKRISEQGPRFFEEVDSFKFVEAKFARYCQSIHELGKMSQYPSNLSELVLGPSHWTEPFGVTPGDCWMLWPNPYEMLHKVQKENDVREAKLLAERSKLHDNRTALSKSIWARNDVLPWGPCWLSAPMGGPPS